MLELTPKEIMENRHMTINPCKTCEPVGAMFCALGAEKVYASLPWITRVLFLSQNRVKPAL